MPLASVRLRTRPPAGLFPWTTAGALGVYVSAHEFGIGGVTARGESGSDGGELGSIGDRSMNGPIHASGVAFCRNAYESKGLGTNSRPWHFRLEVVFAGSRPATSNSILSLGSDFPHKPLDFERTNNIIAIAVLEIGTPGGAGHDNAPTRRPGRELAAQAVLTVDDLRPAKDAKSRAVRFGRLACGRSPSALHILLQAPSKSPRTVRSHRIDGGRRYACRSGGSRNEQARIDGPHRSVRSRHAWRFFRHRCRASRGPSS